MARQWLNDGKPDESGRLCLVIDPEDGTHPLRIWGRTKEEVLEKASKTIEHGQRTISELRSQVTSHANGSTRPVGHGAASASAGAVLPPKKPPLTAGETSELTASLTDPAKAPAAITRLVEGHTGFDFTKAKAQETVERITEIQTNWSLKRADFPKHPTNYTLVNNAAVIRAGGYENITADILDAVFNELQTQGLLVAEEEEAPTESPTVLPAEIPATVRRPRGAASYRRTALSSPAPASASQTPKYTKTQIDKMSSSEIRRRIETEPGFADQLSAFSAAPAN